MQEAYENLRIAEDALGIDAIKLSPRKPFQWASGYWMPIYNDNRLFLGNPDARHRIVSELNHRITSKGLEYDMFAGIATAGIPWASFLAQELDVPMIYVRDKPKEHGLKNQIEGIDAETDLKGRKIIVIEDLISTGGSSAKAVQAIRNANGIVDICMSIFNYGFKEAREMFEGEKAIDDKGTMLNPSCSVESMLTYNTLLKVARAKKRINDVDLRMLEEWREDPFGWGEKNGFPKVKK